MKSFIAINLFGMIVTCEELSKEELNHELIHTAQARELLYIPFYLWYIIEWLFLYLNYLIFNIIKTQRSAGSNAGRFLRLI
jgi:hypothetical protein